MTIQTTTNRVQYTGNGVTTVFAYPFKIFVGTDLEVYVDDANGVPVLVSNYSISGAGSSSGGNVTFTSPPANGRKVTIIRVVPETQETSYPNNDKFPSKAHEDALDKLTMLVQQLGELIDRSVVLPVNTGLTNLELPVGASKYIRWNGTATALELADLVGTGTYADPVTTRGDMIRGNATGDQERFGLGSAGQVLVSNGTDPVWSVPPTLNYGFNGDFEIWGEGENAIPTSFTAFGAGVAFAKNTTAGQFKIGTASVSVTRAGADCGLQQEVTAIPGFGGAGFWKGKTVTLGCWVRATVASRARIWIDDDQAATTFSSYHSGSGSFEWLTVTRAISASAGVVTFGVQVDTGDTTAQFDGLTFVAGSAVHDWLPSAWRGRKAVLLLNSDVSGTVPAGSTVFLYPGGHDTGEQLFHIPFKNAVVRRMFATSGLAPGASQSYTYTLRKTLADSALVATTSGAVTNESNDTTNEVVFSDPSPAVGVKLVTSAGAIATFHLVSVEIEEIP